MWGVRGRALCQPRLPALWAGCRGPLPTGCGCGGCGRGDPSPTPQRALLRAGFARSGRGTRAPGGAPPAWVWGVRSRALCHPRLPALWAGCRGPLPTGCGCGRGAGVGTRHQPHSALSCVLWGRHEGARGGRLLPGCGASGVGRSATPDCPPSGRAAGAHYPLAVGAGAAGVETRHQPHSARFCELALRAVGAARGRLGGAPPAWVWGVRSRALCHPRRPALWAGCRGPLPTGCECGRGAGVGTRHQPHSALSCVLLGRHEAARGGRLLPGCGASGVGRSATPDCPPSGRADGAHYPLAVGAGAAGVETRHQPHSALSCELALRALGAARGRLGGAPPAWVWFVRGRALSQHQEWQGAADTRAQAHTLTPHAPARRGGLQEEHAHQHTHTPTPQPGVAGRSRNPS